MQLGWAAKQIHALAFLNHRFAALQTFCIAILADEKLFGDTLCITRGGELTKVTFRFEGILQILKTQV